MSEKYKLVVVPPNSHRITWAESFKRETLGSVLLMFVLKHSVPYFATCIEGSKTSISYLIGTPKQIKHILAKVLVHLRQ